MEGTEKELENEQIKVVVKQEPRCQVSFDISVSPEHVATAYQKAVKSVRKHVNIPGFRKGRAPDRMVIDHYAPHVEREFRETLLEESFGSAMKLAEIYPLNRNSVRAPDVRNLKKGEAAEFSFRFECEPQMPTIAIDEVELKRPEASEITQEQIDNRIEELRYYHGEWEKVEDRVIEEGDFVDLDINTTATPAFNICTNTRFKMNKGDVPKWMHDLVIGAKAGDEPVGESSRDDEFMSQDNTLDFQPTEVRVTVNAIWKAVLPPVDDALAKKAGVESVEELTQRIREHLQSQADAEVRDNLRKQLEDQLLEKYTFEVPASLYDSERQVRVRKLIEQLKDENVSEEDIQARQQELEEQADTLTDRNLRLYFIALPVAREKKYSADQTEMLSELYRVNALPLHERLIDKDMDHETVRFRLFANICTRKVIDSLLEKAKVV